MKHWPTVPRQSWSKAQKMRRLPTEAEKLLWQTLRSRVLGTVFRRQHPIGPYIADFACLKAKLVIEVDGDSHKRDDVREYDSERTYYFESRGFRVLRFSNREVLFDLENVVSAVNRALHEAQE
jgi:very-short-patch-repair endonuclease